MLPILFLIIKGEGGNIKRPLIGAVMFLIAGILMYKNLPQFIFIILFLISIIFFLYNIKKKYLQIGYVLLPVLFLTGYLLMYKAQLESDYVKALYDEECDSVFTGRVYKVQKSDMGYKILIKKVTADNKKTENAIVYYDTPCKRGDTVRVKGKAGLFESPSNPGEFNLKLYYRTTGIYYKIYADKVDIIKKCSNPVYIYADKITASIEQSLYRITDETTASIYCAMILGNRDNLDKEISDLFSACGIGHILAISGLHISLIGLGIYKIIKRTGAGYFLSMIVSSTLIVFYGIMTGNGISTIRALIMFFMSVYGNYIGRTYDIASAVSFAAIIMLLTQPLLIYNSGFILSFTAIAGIVLVNGPVMRILNTRNKFVTAVAGGASIQAATIPVIMYYYYQIPVLSILLNLVVVPLMTVVMIAGIGGGIAGLVSAFFGRLFIGPGVYILHIYEMVCTYNMKIPWAVITTGRPKLWQMITYYCLLLIIINIHSLKDKKAGLLGVMPIFTFIILRFNYSFCMYFLDVGQGDGIFFTTESGHTFLVDGGSTDNKSLYKYTLKPFLLSRGCDTIDYAIVTHCDNDHISGLKDLLTENTIKIKVLYMPSTTLIDDAYEGLHALAKEKGTEVRFIYEGMSISDGGAVIQCFHPTVQYYTEDRNDYSTVLSIDYRDFSALLTGDISSEQEKIIIDKVSEHGTYDVLKSPHHGSKYSNSLEFLETVQPHNVVVSCGKDNDYGHPHEEAIDNFLKVKSIIKRTDIDGAIIYEKGEIRPFL